MTVTQRSAAVFAAPAALTALALIAAPGVASAAPGAASAAVPRHVTVLVANRGSGTVSPIFTTTNRAGKRIRTGGVPQAIAITPDYKMAYVANGGSGTVTPVRIRTGAARAPVKVGAFPDAIVISPDGKMAYVASTIASA